jgi:uncharacterized membrane protein
MSGILLAAVLAIQACAFCAGFVLVLRRLDRMRADISAMRSLLDDIAQSRAAPARRKRALAGAFHEQDADDIEEAQPVALIGAARGRRGPRLWPHVEPEARSVAAGPRFAPEALRAIGVALLAFAPAAALAVHAPLVLAIAICLCATLAALALSTRALWRPAAWIGALSGGGWALAALLGGAAQAAPLALAAALVAAGAGGLVFARTQERAVPGLALVGFMIAAAIAGGAEDNLVSPFGAAFAALVALGAVIGLSAPRLELVHVGAFVAACFGLSWVSGATQADIWMAPAAGWMGALFLALAALRAPQLGAQGLVVAATGAAAPLIAVASLYAAKHGLGAPSWAAAALLAIAVALGAILAHAARRAGAMAELGWTAWVLGAAAIGACVSAAALATHAPSLAGVLALLALGLALIDRRAPHPLWRAGAVALCLATAGATVAAARQFLAGVPGAPPLWLIGAGVAAPSACATMTAILLRRRAPRAAALFEAFAMLSGAAAVAFLIRCLFSNGAPLLEPVGFAEAGLSGAACLAASLGAGELMRRKPRRRLRRVAAALFAGAGVATCVIGAACLFNPWWGIKPSPASGWPLLNLLLLGYAAPAVAGAAHFLFWRAHKRPAFAHAALVFTALMGGLWLALEWRRWFAGAALDIGQLGAAEAAGLAAIVGATIGAVVLLWAPRGAGRQLGPPQQA